MKLNRRSRAVAALIALMSMLFMQLAMAAYACPALGSAHSDAAMAIPDDSHAMPGCHGMDKTQPSLCHAHAEAGHQSLDKPEVPQIQPFMAVGLTLALTTADTAGSQLAAVPESTEASRATSPPLSIRNCCFRF
jgi:hypothetical protein